MALVATGAALLAGPLALAGLVGGGLLGPLRLLQPLQDHLKDTSSSPELVITNVEVWSPSVVKQVTPLQNQQVTAQKVIVAGLTISSAAHTETLPTWERSKINRKPVGIQALCVCTSMSSNKSKNQGVDE